MTGGSPVARTPGGTLGRVDPDVSPGGARSARVARGFGSMMKTSRGSGKSLDTPRPPCWRLSFMPSAEAQASAFLNSFPDDANVQLRIKATAPGRANDTVCLFTKLRGHSECDPHTPNQASFQGCQTLPPFTEHLLCARSVERPGRHYCCAQITGEEGGAAWVRERHIPPLTRTEWGHRCLRGPGLPPVWFGLKERACRPITSKWEARSSLGRLVKDTL